MFVGRQIWLSLSGMYEYECMHACLYPDMHEGMHVCFYVNIYMYMKSHVVSVV